MSDKKADLVGPGISTCREVAKILPGLRGPALVQFGCQVGEGINTDMRAVRKDYFLDHDHSSYVDQWDWEKVITAEDRNLENLKATVRKI